MDAAVDASTSQFELTEEQRAIQEMAEAFATDRVAPNALDWDRAKQAGNGPAWIFRRWPLSWRGNDAVQPPICGRARSPRFHSRTVFLTRLSQRTCSITLMTIQQHCANFTGCFARVVS